MTSQNMTLGRALGYARRGWPVFPCQPGRKIPATPHGHLDATTSEQQVTAWFGRYPDLNLAIATGTPGPDVLDIDVHPDGDGFPALRALAQAGHTASAALVIRTPGGGLHLYYAGSAQRNGHLPGHHVDFRSAGGYVLAPPSRVAGKPYTLLSVPGGTAGLDWAAVTALLKPARRHDRAATPATSGRDVGRLAAWVARQEEGNRNAALFWAARRALDASSAADLGPLAIAARQAGLGDQEIRATLASARRSAAHRPGGARQAEEAS